MLGSFSKGKKTVSEKILSVVGFIFGFGSRRGAGRNARVLVVIILAIGASLVSSLGMPRGRNVPSPGAAITTNSRHIPSPAASPSVATLSGFNLPEDVAYDPSNNYLYVANFGSNSVSVLNSTNNIVASIVVGGVGANPFGVAYDPSNNFIYVVNHDAGTVSVVNATSNTCCVATVSVGFGVFSAAYNPVNNDVYVTNAGSGSVLAVDSRYNNYTAISVGDGPVGIGYDPLNHDMYVAREVGATTLYAINSKNSIVANITVGSTQSSVAFDPANGDMYVTEPGNTSVIDSRRNTVAATIQGLGGSAVAFDPVNNDMYVANEGSNTVSVVDSTTNTVVATFNVNPIDGVGVGEGTQGVAFYPATGAMYVTCKISNTISVLGGYPTATNISTLSGFSGPEDIAYNPLNNSLYVPNFGSNAVSVLNSTNKIVTSIGVGTNPIGVAYNPSNDLMYVVNHQSFTVSVINATTSSVVANVNIGASGYPYSAEYNPVNNYIYVTDFGLNTVSAIAKNNTIVANISVGANAGPAGVAYDPLNHEVYVANAFSGTLVSVINSTNAVVANINVGATPPSVGFDPANGRMYATAGSTVSVIDGKTNTVIATISGFSGATGVAFNPVDNNMYVTNQASNTVSIIDSKTNTVVATFIVGAISGGVCIAGPGPRGVGFYPATGAMYVTNCGANTISVLGPGLGAFSLSSSGSISVARGSSGSTRITVTSVNLEPVSLSCNPSTLPVGASCSFNPTSSVPTFNSNLTITTQSGTPAGYFSVNVTGTGALTLSNSIIVGLAITPIPLAIDNTTTFSQINAGPTTVRTNGTLAVDVTFQTTIPLKHASLNITGQISVLATNSNNGVALFSGTYSMIRNTTGVFTVNNTAIVARFLFDVAVSPYHLSSDIEIAISGTKIITAVQVTRNVDILLQGSVNVNDFGFLSQYSGCTIRMSCYNGTAGKADLDADGAVDVTDFNILSKYYRTTDFLVTSSIGGVTVPVDKLALLAPFIGLTSILVATITLAAVYLRRTQNKNKV